MAVLVMSVYWHVHFNTHEHADVDVKSLAESTVP